MSVVTLTIDEKLVVVPAGKTLLEAARENGISIPTLCQLDGVSPAAACRMCLVEVGAAGRLMPSCATAAGEGMVIHTNTDRLLRYRRMIMELLFAERNHVCAVCVANGNCELQNLAASVGMDHMHSNTSRRNARWT